jgi:hypothetical protein
MTWRILEGDCRDVLATLDAGSVQTCVTSPPYFGLRDYGHDGQIGLEPTPDEFVAALVGVFREVRRVLRDDGTVWLNLGDSYAGVGWQLAGRLRAADRGAQQIVAHPKRNRTGSIPDAAATRPRTCSASRGWSRSPCAPMAGTCARTSSGRSRTRCRRA